jgi:hypothetical protein
MKNQYCGDINDYRKYGLLRGFAKSLPFRIGVCWMLTPPDGRTDGSRRDYLNRPDRFRAPDPPLFDRLRRIRSVADVERARLIPNALYWKDEVPRSTAEREEWLENMCRRFAKADIVFFDPDNGLEVKSQPWRDTASPKHIYRRELSRVWAGHQSIIIYQHFPRQQREKFIASMKRGLREATGGASVFALRTSHVVFLLAPQQRHRERLARAGRLIERNWPGEIWLQ